MDKRQVSDIYIRTELFAAANITGSLWKCRHYLRRHHTSLFFHLEERETSFLSSRMQDGRGDAGTAAPGERLPFEASRRTSYAQGEAPPCGTLTRKYSRSYPSVRDASDLRAKSRLGDGEALRGSLRRGSHLLAMLLEIVEDDVSRPRPLPHRRVRRVPPVRICENVHRPPRTDYL